MTPGVFAATLVLATSAPNAPSSADPRDLHHCKLRAIHPTDNDIHFEDDRRFSSRPAKIPLTVSRRILDHVSSIAKKQFTVREWSEAKQRCADIFPPVFKLIGPGGLQLYVAPRNFVLGNTVDYFFMYDPRTGAVTSAPPLIYTKWSSVDDALMKRPIVRMESGTKGGFPRLIVEERTHNGTVYNAVVYRYFEIGKEMSLKQVLAVEARAYALPAGLTTRTATFLGPNRVRIVVSTTPPHKFGSHGTVLLERSGSGQPFHVARRAAAHGDYTLVTYCDTAKNDDDFLRVGCDWYY
jgi:hypothetical protein